MKYIQLSYNFKNNFTTVVLMKRPHVLNSRFVQADGYMK